MRVTRAKCIPRLFVFGCPFVLDRADPESDLLRKVGRQVD